MRLAYRAVADACGAIVAMEVPTDIVRYFGDAQRLQQVFGNLLSNAIKFVTPEGRRIEIHMEATETLVRVSVRDHGRGIEPAFLPYLFEPFRQADTDITRTHGGLGLGLTISRSIVELHKGALRAESSGPGHGAVMTVELPRLGAREIGDPAWRH